MIKSLQLLNLLCLVYETFFSWVANSRVGYYITVEVYHFTNQKLQ